MRHLSLGSFTCPHCREEHLRSVDSCPRTGLVLDTVHKMGGTTLESKYRITDVIAEGGMGIVYKAVHKLTRADLAVKFLNPETCKTREAYERFTREARIAASVDHPGIIQVHDLGITHDGIPYIVMERLQGVDLSRRIAEAGQLDIGEAVGITEQVLEALRAVHEAGIVHRDLKPENIFIARQSGGTLAVKILDFGVSRLVREGDSMSRLTQAGKVYGTPHYVSPEQACGDLGANHRADLYAVAVIFYEMLVGSPPFDADTPSRLIIDIVTAPPPNPLEKRPDLQPSLAGFILRGLEKDPASRFQSADEMLRALRVARSTRPLTARRPKTPQPATAPSGSYRIIGPPAEVVVSKMPYREMIGSNVLPGPNGVERLTSQPASRKETMRTRPMPRARLSTPGHRADITPNPDMGDPDEDG